MGPLTARREFLTGAAICAATGIAGCASPSATESPGSSTTLDATAQLPDALGLQTTVGGLDAPLAVAFVSGTDQRYIAERDGRVLRHGPSGLQDELFLDLRDTVETEGEKGLLGIALHPDFPDDRRLFVRYSAPLREGMPEDYSHTFVLAAFEVTENGTRARSDSERSILEIPQPRDLHNGGDLAFGPDGYLYVSVGDSGESPEDVWYDGPGGGNGQDVTENLLGSVLRLDVDTRTGDQGYVVPEDNPLVGRDGLDEHYAWGFRNPWRLSFDGEDLYVADVGQNRFEEVNLVEKGGNYGWNVKEGTHCYKTDDCPDRTPDDVRGGEPLRDPIVEYHTKATRSAVSRLLAATSTAGRRCQNSTDATSSAISSPRAGCSSPVSPTTPTLTPTDCGRPPPSRSPTRRNSRERSRSAVTRTARYTCWGRDPKAVDSFGSSRPRNRPPRRFPRLSSPRATPDPSHGGRPRLESCAYRHLSRVASPTPKRHCRGADEPPTGVQHTTRT
ncbi:PQQ-dependent sugar dehydrogenase [Saliphagus sp. GCM10025317]